MAVASPRLGLARPEVTDEFLTSGLYGWLTTLDSYPGIFICTSGTRPGSWGAAHTGMRIWETDTNLLWRWNGTAFVRVHPLGLLQSPAQITADFATAATAAAAAITASAVTIPATDAGSTTKRIEVTAQWYGLDNGTATTLGACEVSLIRLPATVLAVQLWKGRPTTATSPLDWGPGGSIVGYDNPTAGAQSYVLAVNSLASVGGTTTLRASPSAPATISVKEVGL